MSIFKRKAKPITAVQAAHVVKQVNVPLMLHRFLLDSGISEAQQLSTLMGLPPLDDVEVEIEESSERIFSLTPLAPLLAVFASVMSDSVIQYYMTMSDQSADPEETEHMVDLFSKVTMATLRGTLTQLHDLGLISYSYDKATA
jgi:hypothetical protein